MLLGQSVVSGGRCRFFQTSALQLHLGGFHSLFAFCWESLQWNPAEKVQISPRPDFLGSCSGLRECANTATSASELGEDHSGLYGHHTLTTRVQGPRQV